MTSLHAYLSLNSGLTLDENALIAFAKQSQARLWLQLDGDRERVIEDPADLELWRPKLLKRTASWLSLEASPFPLYIDPQAVVSLQPLPSGDGFHIHARGMADPLVPSTPEAASAFLKDFRAWSDTQGNWIWLDEQTGFNADELAAVQLQSDHDLAHTLFILAEGSPLWWTGAVARDILNVRPLQFLTPHLWLMPSYLAAYRQRYAGESKEAMADWLMYVGHNQQVELTGPSRSLALDALRALTENDASWLKAPSGPVFHLENLTSYVYEVPRAEMFDPRLGIYLREGHEFNLYDKKDVEAILPRLKSYAAASTHFVRLANGTCFDTQRLVSWEASHNTLQLTLANGPGLTLIDPQDLAVVQDVLSSLL